jgi:hypothetical protein
MWLRRAAISAMSISKLLMTSGWRTVPDLVAAQIQASALIDPPLIPL